jgi:uncharacterized OsmC-like protein
MEAPYDTISLSVAPGPGRTKLVAMPVDGTVPMGMRGRVAEHYRVSVADFDPHATSLDYLVGATAACLTGTFSGLLNHAGQPTHDGALTADAVGTVVKERGVLRVAAIRVDYALALADGVDRDEVLRLHEIHPSRCPVARSVTAAIELSTTLDLR